jgi:chemotaxis-related protein WspD
MSQDQLNSSDRKCWNLVGNQGDNSCPDLDRHIHCRNCPVFSQAARRLLDRELPGDYARTWANHYGRTTEKLGAQTQSAILFRLADEWLAITPTVLLEICEPCLVHSLPHQRKRNLRGLINHRGVLVVCVSLELALDINPMPSATTPGPSRDRLLLLKSPGGTVAALVQEVVGIHRFAVADLQPPPTTLSRARISYTEALIAWRHHWVALLKHGPLMDELNRCLA